MPASSWQPLSAKQHLSACHPLQNKNDHWKSVVMIRIQQQLPSQYNKVDTHADNKNHLNQSEAGDTFRKGRRTVVSRVDHLLGPSTRDSRGQKPPGSDSAGNEPPCQQALMQQQCLFSFECQLSCPQSPQYLSG